MKRIISCLGLCFLYLGFFSSATYSKECGENEIMLMREKGFSVQEINNVCTNNVSLPTSDDNSGDSQESVAQPETFTPKTISDHVPVRELSSSDWHFKLGFSSIYTMGLGPEMDAVIGQIEGFAAGKEVNLDILHYHTSLKLFPDEKMARTDTDFLPTVNLGLSHQWGQHQIELDVGILGLISLNTINLNTRAIMRESTCDGSCPMADLGFVNAGTGEGLYRLRVVMNENIWILTPSIYYDYTLSEGSWGRMFVGGGAGFLILTLIQDLQIQLERQDSVLEKRAIEISAFSSAINQPGPIGRLYGGMRMGAVEVRAGLNYGWVSLIRDVDGSGTVYLGNDQLDVTFPLSSVSVAKRRFESQEINKLEVMGLFIHAGVVF
ncbi:MAG: hypothetical protein HQM11_09935 [SAR324 cluster bacterium]|nr:hypothetical protein [SAR324 cluster bacterium]